MANIHTIELGGENYNIEDTQARADTLANSNKIGTLANLQTITKENLVDAINEVLQSMPQPKTSIMDFYELIKTPDGNDKWIGQSSYDSTISFIIPNWEKYKGIMIECKNRQSVPSLTANFSSPHQIFQSLKGPDGSCQLCVSMNTYSATEYSLFRYFSVDGATGRFESQCYQLTNTSGYPEYDDQDYLSIYKIYGIL